MKEQIVEILKKSVMYDPMISDELMGEIAEEITETLRDKLIEWTFLK